MRTVIALVLAAALALAFGRITTSALAARGLLAPSCESLASLSLSSATITAAQVVAAGTFAPPAGGRAGGRSGQDPFAALPAFCRVAATLKPTSDSDIKIEVWLPVSGWNGKFQAVGNGGWAGAISYPAMAEALKRGYATTSTDTGHTGASGAFALGHPEKFVDFAWRSEHEMTIAGKALVNAFYGRAPRYAFWNGCSTGGRQGLAEAQRFPDDFDGIIAGASANPRTYLNSWPPVFGSWRQVADVSRVDGRQRRAARERQLLQQRPEDDGRSVEDGSVAAAVHGPWHGPLRWR